VPKNGAGQLVTDLSIDGRLGSFMVKHALRIPGVTYYGPPQKPHAWIAIREPKSGPSRREAKKKKNLHE